MPSNLPEYTQQDMTITEAEKEIYYLEEMCRAMCEEEGVDPDREMTIKEKIYRVAEGVTYKLWQYRLPTARRIIAALEKRDFYLGTEA